MHRIFSFPYQSNHNCPCKSIPWRSNKLVSNTKGVFFEVETKCVIFFELKIVLNRFAKLHEHS